ncbi:MAG: zinc-dependent peptidase [Candidatus Eisenbacteria bacterium]|uniref:Zinc-dependent peptidase n=1 Tax=Eiseniibacteriota bacterium TaxID=2212470 RepID=A0A538SDA9_UNCEI|nr:MAG: zinc-dependent peptidase [Candidatus Eisenbacteria bacterium]
MFDFFARRRRARLRAQPFPEDWLAIMSRNVPLYGRLPAELQARLRGDVQVLLAEKHFEGCGGLRLDDEIRVTIAAHAALLMLGDEPHYYPRLTSILVYPSTFLVRREERQGPITAEGRTPLLGESWRTGAVVLAWDAALKGARDVRDGQNVILHEFAHQLDSEDGKGDGTPFLDSRGQYAAWARAMAPEFERLRAQPEGSLLGEYAATNPAEFFAVATEVFFEQPEPLRLRHPEMYAELSRYYGLDPAGDS